MSWVTLDRIVSEEIVRDDGIRRRVASPGRNETELSRAPPHRKPDGSATSGFRRRIAADQVGRVANGGLRGRRAGGRLKL